MKHHITSGQRSCNDSLVTHVPRHQFNVISNHRQVAESAGCKVIENANPLPAADKFFCKMSSDETCTARNKMS